VKRYCEQKNQSAGSQPTKDWRRRWWKIAGEPQLKSISQEHKTRLVQKNGKSDACGTLWENRTAALQLFMDTHVVWDDAAWSPKSKTYIDGLDVDQFSCPFPSVVIRKQLRSNNTTSPNHWFNHCYTRRKGFVTKLPDHIVRSACRYVLFTSRFVVNATTIGTVASMLRRIQNCYGKTLMPSCEL